jgi:hypothetical protein
MFCGYCGAENDDRVQFCISCGKLLAEIGDGSNVTIEPDPVQQQDPGGAYQAPPPGSIPSPPPGQYQAAYGSGPSQNPYQQDGNTSGMGPGYPMPPEASNFNFGGCIPYGIFGFANGSVLWGVLAWLVPFASLYLNFKGNELAWQSRRFASRQQYLETMNAWNMWGKVILAVQLLGMILYFAFVGIFVAMGMSGAFDELEDASSTTYYNGSDYSDGS